MTTGFPVDQNVCNLALPTVSELVDSMLWDSMLWDFHVFCVCAAAETTTFEIPQETTTPVMPPVPESPETLHKAVCPNMQPGPSEPCPWPRCSSDRDCSEGQMCCSNPCGGRACVDPDQVPYYAVPRECPSADSRGGTGNCTTRRPSCTDDSVCAENQLCCPNGNCGSFCVNGVESSQPCSVVRGLLLVGGRARPGAFVPACQDNGKFAPTQFYGSTGYSWCVNVETGQPVSGFYPRGTTAQCPSETYRGWILDGVILQ